MRYLWKISPLLFLLCLAFSLSARETLSLDGTWRFATDPDANGETLGLFLPGAELPAMPLEGYDSHANGTIQVPGIWDNQGYGTPTDKLYHNFVGHGWYKRVFTLPKEWEGTEVILTLGGISRYAKVWINGQLIAPELKGQVASFSVDVTGFLNYGQENDITIRVDNHQRWEEDAILGVSSLNDYMEIEWGGLWGHVTLESRSKEHLDSLYLKTNLAENRCTAEAVVVAQKDADAVRFDLYNADGTLAASSQETLVPETGKITLSVVLSDPNLWTPESPYLYTAKLTLLSQNEEIDQVGCRYGMREFKMEGSQLLLNGKPIYLCGYGDDHVYPYEFSMPTNKEMYRRRLMQIKAYGFNHVRHHSTILPHEYYDVCDELGMISTAEFPICYPIQLPGHEFWKKKVPEGISEEPALALYRERFTKVVQEYRNHPCILIWVMGNELSGGMSINQDFKAIAQKYDPDRFFSDTDGDPEDYYYEGNERRSTVDLCFVAFDEWRNPLYGKKFDWTIFQYPTIAHETGNYITLIRPDQVDLFRDGHFEGNPSWTDSDTSSPMTSDYKPFWMTDGVEKCKKIASDEEVQKWVDASEALYYVHHKANIESARLNPTVIGYHWWLIQDYWTTSNGLFDLFFRPKSITPEQLRLFNAPLVLLQKGFERTYGGGDELRTDFSVSNYLDHPVTGTFAYTLTMGAQKQSGTFSLESLQNGTVKMVGTALCSLPNVEEPTNLRLEVTLTDSSGEILQRNEWSSMLYPSEVDLSLVRGKKVYASPDAMELLPSGQKVEAFSTDQELDPTGLYIVTELTPQIAKALDLGAGVLFVGEEYTFPFQRIHYQQTWWKGGDLERDNHIGTYVYPTELMKPLESAIWCRPAWITLFEGARKFYLDLLPSVPNIHIRALPSLLRVQNTAVLFDVGVGKGTLVVSGLNHRDAKERPEGGAILKALLQQAATGPSGPASWDPSDIGPVCAVPQGTVLGYQELLPSHFETSSRKSWRWTDLHLPDFFLQEYDICRLNSQENFLSWRTGDWTQSQERETSQTVTFIFCGALGDLSDPESGGFVLELNDEPKIFFSETQRPVPASKENLVQWRSADGKMTLEFEVILHEEEDHYGRFRLTVPKSVLTAGPQKLTVRSLGEDSSRWFGLEPVFNMTNGEE